MSSGMRSATETPGQGVLLDTHIWIWFLVADARLRPAHRKLIADPAVELWLSSVSIWEAHLLIEKGRLRTSLSPNIWIRQALQVLSIREAPLTFRIAVVSR